MDAFNLHNKSKLETQGWKVWIQQWQKWVSLTFKCEFEYIQRMLPYWITYVELLVSGHESQLLLQAWNKDEIWPKHSLNKAWKQLTCLNYLVQGSSQQQDQNLMTDKRYQNLTKWSIKQIHSELNRKFNLQLGKIFR